MVATRSSSNVTATQSSKRPATPVKMAVPVPSFRELSASRNYTQVWATKVQKKEKVQQRPPRRAAAVEATKRMSAMAAESYDFDE